MDKVIGWTVQIMFLAAVAVALTASGLLLMPIWLWLLLFVVMAASAYYAWRRPEFPRDAKTCLNMAAVSVIAAIGWFFFWSLLFKFIFLSWEEGPGLLNIVLVITMCPFLTSVYLGGAARWFYLRRD